MKQDKLRIGDEVVWRNSWGKDAPQRVKDWSKVKAHNLIIDFYDNTNWAWAYQIEKLEE